MVRLRRRRAPRTAAVAALALAMLAIPAFGVAEARAVALDALQARLLAGAERAVTQAQSPATWGNPAGRWFNGQLDDRRRSPLATIWEAVPLLEAVDYDALAQPSKANVAQVRSLADYAQRYWDRNITPAPGIRRRTPAYAPYPGSWNDPITYFDDNAWWSLAFLDARRVMLTVHDSRAAARYLADARRGFAFIAAYGWDAQGGGMWWNTAHTIPGGHGRSGEALAAATELAARLYQITGERAYLRDADRYIVWANHHLLKWDGSYAQQIPHEVVMPHDGEGAMIAAFTVLCEAGAPVPRRAWATLPPNSVHANPSFRLPPDPRSWCSWAQALARHTALGVRLGARTYDAFLPLNEGPQWDAIYVRGLLTLYRHDHQPLWYELAADTAVRILLYARAPDGLFLRAWNGDSPVPGARPQDIQTDAASISVLAALAASTPPARTPGPLRALGSLGGLSAEPGLAALAAGQALEALLR
jgi:hypothetical protein